uniref:NADH dehydrogenase subunit 6 n=1 Tax=Aposthonia borneensis TaxID=1208762 RepID=A0A678PVU5_9NEOP|nr:NADH dehydrogenase subunit 6 [Aposthonia borneensis]
MKMMNFMMTSMFIYFSHPLILTIIILVQTINSCFIMGTYLKNFWIPYILFIIMLSGLMIMFMYMCSTTPNQLIKSPNTTLMISAMMMISMTYMDKHLKNMFMNTLTPPTSFHTDNLFNTLINLPMQLMFMSMLMFLTLSMFTAMKISSTSNKPLRSN